MDSETRTALADVIYSLYLSGKLDSVSKIHGACLSDGLLFGKVMMKVKEHKESQEAVAKNEYIAPVSSESNAAAEGTPVASDTAESAGVSGEGCCEGQTASVKERAKKVTTRRRIPRKIRVLSDEPDESEAEVPRHESKRDCCERVSRLFKFW
jgi:hypothetical protein